MLKHLDFVFFSLFVWLHQALVAAWGTFDLRCSMQDLSVVTFRLYFPAQRLNPGSLHWEHGVLATGPLGKSWHPDCVKDFFLIEVFLIYNVLISAIQQSDSVIYRFSFIFFPSCLTTGY